MIMWACWWSDTSVGGASAIHQWMRLQTIATPESVLIASASDAELKWTSEMQFCLELFNLKLGDLKINFQNFVYYNQTTP